MAKIRTHYDNLKVSKDAPIEVIQAAYRSLARKYHPDRNGSTPEGEAMMKTINASYEVLSDPDRRAQHDQWIASQVGSRGWETRSAGQHENRGRRKQRKPWTPVEVTMVIVYFFTAIMMLRIPSARVVAIVMLLAGWAYVKVRNR